jgi:PST family polysaccharide transporter
VIEKALGFATTAVLARLLAPEEFGLYALAFVAIDALAALKNLGLDAALVQRRDHEQQAADSAFLVLPFVSGSLFILLFLGAPHVAGWLGAPDVAGPLRGLGLALVIVGLGAVPNALLQKKLLFGARVTATLLGAVSFSVVAITLALAGWDVWSLVIAHLLRTMVTSAVCWLRVEWRPRWRLDRAILGQMLGFSTYVMGANLLNVAAVNADKVLVGRLLGPTSVGLYSLACGLAFLFRGQVGPRLYQVAFPAFAEAQDDTERLRRGTLRVVQALLGVVLPFAVLVGLLSRDVLTIAYGSKWAVAAPALSVLAVGGAFGGLSGGLNPLLLARGHSKIQFGLNLGELLLFLAIAPWATSLFGLVGAAAAATASATASAAARAAVANRELALDWRDWAIAARAPLLAGVAMATTILVGEGLAGGWGEGVAPFWRFSVLGGLGGTAYTLVLWKVDPDMVRWLGTWISAPFRGRARRTTDTGGTPTSGNRRS